MRPKWPEFDWSLCNFGQHRPRRDPGSAPDAAQAHDELGNVVRRMQERGAGVMAEFGMTPDAFEDAAGHGDAGAEGAMVKAGASFGSAGALAMQAGPLGAYGGLGLGCRKLPGSGCKHRGECTSKEHEFRSVCARVRVSKGDGKKLSMTTHHEGWKTTIVEALRASGGDLKSAPPPHGHMQGELALYVPDLATSSASWAGAVAAAAA